MLAVGATSASALLSAEELQQSGPIQLGPPEVVLTNGQYGLRYFPDGSLAVVQTRPTCLVLAAAKVSTWLLEGPEMGKLLSAHEVLAPGKKGEFDNGYAGVNGQVWHAPGGEVLAIYHAEDQENMPAIGQGIPGFYCRIGAALSRDGGRTYQKLGPIISSHEPKNLQGRPAQGNGEPALVAEPTGRFLYTYYTAHNESGPVDIRLARAPVQFALHADAWAKFYISDFDEAALGGKDSSVLASHVPDSDALFPNVLYLPALKQFVMFFCIQSWREKIQAERSGFYAAFSDDGISWPIERRVQIWKVPTLPLIGRELAWHPTLVVESSSTGVAKGWLYYSYSESWGHKLPCKPHYLVRRQITIQQTVK